MPPKRLQITFGDEANEQASDDSAALLALIAALALEDVKELQNHRAGDGTAISADEELALRLYAEEASALDTFAQDVVMAQSLEKAMETDAGLLEELARLEEMARRDREFAIALSQGRMPQPAQPQRNANAGRVVVATRERPVTAAQSPSTRSALTLVEGTGDPDTRALVEMSAQTSETASKSREWQTCVICRDDIDGPVIRAPCGDTYDLDCLVSLYRAATVDETLFPPSCCRQPFNFHEVRAYMDSQLVKLVDKKAIEFGTKNRVYCHRPTCSTFLGAATASVTQLLCTTCWHYTCGHCKGAEHSATVRCTSAEDAVVVALAEQEGWKRCPGCGHLVELSVGCYHMTCRCRHQFCYVCTAKWKTCTCAQWDEARLFTAAENRVQRQGVQPARPGAPNIGWNQQVAREAERLRHDHDCAHRWRYVSDPGRCDSCGHHLRVFLYHCQQCQMRACARCTRNRWL
ncbi:hypothetical protein PYCCODRAFT_1070477 [Trametes coccinea BRFM310]|uniref:RBR-type E3 ubiquitin transferase n=1 Tax=Trametes coccinea (strain BRFM310) TaxID=1353009 RepID=A0A1Y2IY13_TRAC3|nr:hypothetical protein PYCCODRAFT_1070477 [Trametes coccinea BRFM310]